MAAIKSVCVYCGSSGGEAAVHGRDALVIGEALGKAGLRLVYGGGNTGLMQAVADGALAGGGEVLGVIPAFLLERERGKREITDLRVVPDMHVRKMTMFEESDAFIVLPGGLGTLEELFEILTWKQLGQHDKPIVVAGADGYWQSLKTLVDDMRRGGFVHSWREDLIGWADSADAVKAIIGAWAAR